MKLTSLLLLAVALGSDAFSVCLGLGLAAGPRTWKTGLFVLTVAALHVVLPLAGWYLGRSLSLILARYTVYVGAAVLLLLGCRLLGQALGPREAPPSLPAGPVALFLLAVSVSLDSLPAGLVLSSRSYSLVPALALIGLTAGLMTALGFLAGRRLGLAAGPRAQALGGLVLVLLGVKLALGL